MFKTALEVIGKIFLILFFIWAGLKFLQYLYWFIIWTFS